MPLTPPHLLLVVLVALALHSVVTIQAQAEVVAPLSVSDDAEVLAAVSARDPVGARVVTQQAGQRAKLQKIKDMKKEVSTMLHKVRNTPTPDPRPYPVMSPHLNRILKQTQNVRRGIESEHIHAPGSSPAEAMMFDRIYRGVKKANYKIAEQQAPRPIDPVVMSSISSLTNQLSRLGGSLESKESMDMHQKAHAQSRLLHRMTHALGALSNTIEDRKREKYEGMMDVLMQHHLSDPLYYDDTLHDHLLAHHLVRAREQDKNAFANNVAHKMLFHRLDKHIDTDEDVNTHIAQYAARPIAVDSVNSNEKLRERTLQNQQVRPIAK